MKPKTLLKSLVLVALVLASIWASQSRALPEITQEGFAMDSYYQIKAALPTGASQSFRIWLARELTRIEERYDLFSPDSYLNQFNQGLAPLDQELAYLLQTGEDYSRLSQGAYELDIAPLTLLWKEAFQTGTPPGSAQIETALDKVGEGSLELDLGSLIKGYTADLIYAELQNLGATRALVDLGGTIRVWGEPALLRSYWKVAVRDPESKGTLGYFQLKSGQAIATSGDYERGFNHAGKRYHHIIDPRTGYPAQDYAAVTVVADSALRADILSTLLFVTGPSGLKLLEELGPVQVLFINKEGKSELYGSLDVEWVRTKK